MYRVQIEPGGHEIRVSENDNVLGAALAAGIALPHSCRAGRCASCKAKLLAGTIAYPGDRLPPGIVAMEAARGEVLLCQARPRSDLTIAARLAPGADKAVRAVILSMEPLPLAALSLRLRIAEGQLQARPGQFVDVSLQGGGAARLAIIGIDFPELALEVIDDGSALRHWLTTGDRMGGELMLRGPFDAPR